MHLDKRTQQEVLAVLRYQITIAPNGVARQNLWNLYHRVAGHTHHKDFQGFLFSELIIKRGGFLAVLLLGFLCAAVLRHLSNH